MALTEVAVATGDAIDGEVLADLEIGGIVAGGLDRFAIQFAQYPVVVLQILLTKRAIWA